MATLYVGSSQAYQTIADAVKAANSGDTIIVKGSEYTATDERVRIDKSLNLIAEGDVTLRGMNIGGKNFDLVVDGFTFVADAADANKTGYTNNASCISQVGNLRNVTVVNCTFDISNAGDTRTYGMFLSLGTWGFENLVVRNNVCYGSGSGEEDSGYGLIYAANVNNADVSQNTVSDVTSHAIQLSLTGVKYQGDGEQTVVIDGNTVNNVYGSGIYCADLHNSNMTVGINDNVITNTQTGTCSIYHGAIRIGAATISGVEITNNVVEGAQVGIYNAAELKEGSAGSINISGNAIAVSQIHPAEEGVTPEFSGLGGASIPAGAEAENTIVEGSELAADTKLDIVNVNTAWSSFEEGTKVAVNGEVFVIGVNAFADVNSAAAVAEKSAGKLVVLEGANVTYDANKWFLLNAPQMEIESGKWNYDVVVDASETYDLQIDGTLGAYQVLLNNAETNVSKTGKLFANSEALRVMGGTFTVEGVREAGAADPDEVFVGSWGGGTKPGADTQIKAGYMQFNQGAVAEFNNTVVFVNAGWMNFDNAAAEFNNTYIYLGSGGSYAPVAVQIANGAEVTLANNTTMINDTTFTMSVSVDAASTLVMDDAELIADSVSNDGKININGEAASLIDTKIFTNNGAITVNGVLNVAAESFVQGDNGSITISGFGSLVADDIAGTGAITIDAAGFTGVNKVLDLSRESSMEGSVKFINRDEKTKIFYGTDGDVVLSDIDTDVIYVNAEYDGDLGDKVAEGKYFGINAFNKFDVALVQGITPDTTTLQIESDVTVDDIIADNYMLPANLLVTADKGVTIDFKNTVFNPMSNQNKVIVFGHNVNLVNVNQMIAWNSQVILNGDFSGANLWTLGYNAENNAAVALTINETSKVKVTGQMEFRGGVISVNGIIGNTADALNDADKVQLTGNGVSNWGGDDDGGKPTKVYLNNTYVKLSQLTIGGDNADYMLFDNGFRCVTAMDNSILEIANGGKFDVASFGKLQLTNDSILYLGSRVAAVNRGTMELEDSSLLAASDFSNSGKMEFSGSKFVADNNIVNNGTMEFADSEVIAAGEVVNTGTMEFAGSKFAADGEVVNTGDILVSGEETSELDFTFSEGSTAMQVNVLGGGLKDSEFNGDVLVTGDAAFEGENSFDNIKVTNGAELVINGTLTGADSFIGAGNDAEYYGMENGEIAGGSVIINGDVTVYQVNANDGGYVEVAENATLTTNIICVENGGIENATAGEMKIAGSVETQRFNIFGGATVTVTGYLYSDQAYTSSDVYNVISISDGGTLNIAGGEVVAGSVEHTGGRHAGMAVGESSAVNVSYGSLTIGGDLTNGGDVNVSNSSLTVDGTLTNNGTVKVTGVSVVNIAALIGTYVRFENASIYEDSTVGGNIRAYENFDVYGNFTVKQSNLYGTTVIHDGAVYTGSTTIVSAGGNLTLENGATINSKFFNVVGGTADISGDIALDHSDPRQKLLQIHENGVLNLNENGNITITRHNAVVNAGGTLNVNGGTLTATADTVNVAADRGGVLYNDGEINVNAGLVDIKNWNNNADAVANIYGGEVSVSDTFTNAGMVELNGANLSVAGSMINTGTVDITGKAVLYIASLTGTINIADNGILYNSYIGGGAVAAAGTTGKIEGVNNIGALYVGHPERDYTEAVALSVTGDLTVSNMVVGKLGTLNIGNNEADRTAVTGIAGVSFNSDSTVNVANADIAFKSVVSMSGNVAMDNAKMQLNWNSAAEGKIVLNNGSVLEATAGFYLGGFGSDKGGELVINETAAALFNELYTSEQAVITLNKSEMAANAFDLNGTVNIDAFSTITVNNLNGFTYSDTAVILVDATNLVGVWKILDLNNEASLSEALFNFANGNEYFQAKYMADGDVIISNADTSTVFVNENWADKEIMDDLGDGKYFGFNAFADVDDAVKAACDKTGVITVQNGDAVHVDLTTTNPNGLTINMGYYGISLNGKGEVVSLESGEKLDPAATEGSEVYSTYIGKNVTVNADYLWQLTDDVEVAGTVNVTAVYKHLAEMSITGTLNVSDIMLVTGVDGVVNVAEGGLLNAKSVKSYDDSVDAEFIISGTANVKELEFGGTVTLNAAGVLNSSNIAVNHFINHSEVEFANTHVSIGKLDNYAAITVSGNKVMLDETNNAADGAISVVGGSLVLTSKMENLGSFTVSGGEVSGDAFLTNKGAMEITGGKFSATNLNNTADGSFVASGDSVLEIKDLINSGDFLLTDNVSLALDSVRNNATVTLEDFQGNLTGFVKSDDDRARGIIQVYGDTKLTTEVGTSDLYIGEKERETADSLTVTESAVINASNLYVKKSGSLTIEAGGEVNVIGHYNDTDGLFANYGKTDVSGTLNITNDESCGTSTIGGADYDNKDTVLNIKEGGVVNLNTTAGEVSARFEIMSGAELNVEKGAAFNSDSESRVYNHGTMNVAGSVDLGYTDRLGDRAENSLFNDGIINITGGEFAAEEVVNDDNGSKYGTINIDSTGVLKAGIVSNGTKDTLRATINMAAGGLIVADEFVNRGQFNITVEDDGVWLVVDAAAGTSDFGVIKVNGVTRNEDLMVNDVENGDLYLVNTDNDALYFNSEWAPELAAQLGANTFTDTVLNGSAVEIKDGINAVKFYEGAYTDYVLGKDVALETMDKDIAEVNLTAEANVTISNGTKGDGTRFTASDNSVFTITENGSLTVEDKSEFAVGTINNAGSIKVDGVAAAAMNNSGEVVINKIYTGDVTGNTGSITVNGEFTGDIANSGMVEINGTVSGNMVNSGTLQLNVSNTFGDFANSKNVNIGVNGVFIVTGDFTNSGVFTVDVADGFTGAKRVIDLNDNAEYTWNANSVVFNGLTDGMQIFVGKDGDVAVVGADVKMDKYVFNNAWSTYKLADAIEGMDGFYFGVNAFSNTSEITAQHWGETPEQLAFYTGSYEDLTLNLDLAVETLPQAGEVDNKIDMVKLTANKTLTVKADTTFAMNGELALNGADAVLNVEYKAIAEFTSITISAETDLVSTINGKMNIAGDMQVRNMDIAASAVVKAHGMVEVLDNTEFNVLGTLRAATLQMGNGDSEDGLTTVNIYGVNAEAVFNDVTVNSDSALNVFDTATITSYGTVVNNGFINVSNAFFTGGADIINTGKIYITGSSEFSATVTGNGSLRMADGATLDGDLTADMLFVERNGYFAENASFTGKLNGKYMFVGGSKNTLNITAGSNATLVIEDGTVFQDGDDTLGDIDLKGVQPGTVLTAADSVFEGNRLEDIKLEITDADNRIDVDVDLENIISINGYTLEKLNGIYYYTDENNVQMYVTRDEINGEYVISVADGSQPNAVTVADVKNFSVAANSTELANVNLKMNAGKTTITVKNGKENKRIEFAVGSILKSSLGGTNIIKIGNYNDVSINGIITNFGGMTIGNKSNVTIGAKDDNGDFIANTGNITAQNNSEAIKIGSDSTVTFAGNISLPGGKNSVSVGARSDVAVLGNVSGMYAFTVAAGKKAKADGTGEDYTVVSINGDYIAADMNNKLTIGNYASFTLGTADNGKGNISNGGVESNTGTTIKVGTASKMTVYGDADGVAGLTTGKDSFVVFGTANREGGNITGTAKNNKISVGANATFKAYDIDLASGKNTITTAKGENTVFKAGNISNVQTINVGGLSSFTADSITGVNKFTVNNGKAATKKAEAVLTEAVIKGDVLMTGGKDTFKVGSNSEVKVLGNNDRNSEDKIFGEINFGAGKDTLTMGKDSKLFVGDIKGLEVFNASKGATIEIANGADNDVYLDDVTGSWDKATIIDYEGELDDGFFSGSVYANETDAYELNVADGKKFELLCDNEDVVITYAEFDDNGVLGEFKLYEAGMKLDEGHYGISVKVAGDYEDKYEKKGYDLTGKLA